MYRIITGDVREKLKELSSESVQMCVTSPPYWGLRDYGHPGQIGLERTPEEYVQNMVEVFREVRRVLRKDGTLWLNLGDSYATPKEGNTQGTSTSSLHHKNPREDLKQLREESRFKKLLPPNLKPKDLVGIPWRVAFALQADGWYLRSDIIWSKPNPMPESVTDRPTKAHEYLFLLAKSQKYYYDAEAVKENIGNPTRKTNGMRSPAYLEGRSFQNESDAKWENYGEHIDYSGRNRRSVWTIPTKPFRGAHFATFPADLIEPCIRAGSKEGDTVLDPFVGSGTTLEVSERLGRNSIGIELNEKYVEEIIKPRLAKVNPLFTNEG